MGKARTQRASKAEEELHSAARNGDLSSIQSILSSNPMAVNSRDKLSRTPLHLAAWSGQTEVVTYLCKNRADVGAAAMDDMAAIHFAAQKGHLETVRALISAGASFKSLTRKGLTPLHYASQGSHMELVKYFVRKGAGIGSTTKAGKTTVDCAGNKETRAFLEACQNGEVKPDETVEKPESPMIVMMKEEEENSGGETAICDGPEDEGSKRKCDEIEEGSEGPEKEKKKAKKVVPSHLVSEDDTLDDEEAE